MAYVIPTTEQLASEALSRIQSKLNQTVPANDRAFARVIASVLAALTTGNYKYAAERALQNLAITATGADLDTIGQNYGIERKLSEAAQFTATLPATNGTVIPITVDFVGDANGIRYSLDSAATASGGLATLQLTSKTLGVAGNLNIADTLTIGFAVPGATSVATITVITNTGAETETDANYRLRILDQIRAVPGGGNASDYRIWAQEVAGVARAYPFAGKPIGSVGASAPPDRTVYIEATTNIDPDGIAPQSLLDEVRATINTDPVTGLSRQPLGLTDATLYVESIVRTAFYVQIVGLVVDANILAEVQSNISTALTTYFRGVRPFVDGVDAPLDRNDAVSDPSVSAIVQDVVSASGGRVSSVAFGLSPGTNLPLYQLAQNELGRLGGVSYV